MSSLGLKEREDQAAGNADDSLNPGNKHYNDELLNKKKGASDQEINDDFDGIMAANGMDAPDEKVDAHGDKVRRNYNADNADPSENINDVNQQENGGGNVPAESIYREGEGSGRIGVGTRLMMRFGAGSKKYGAGFGIAGMLVLGLLGVDAASTTLAGSLLVNIKEVFHNDRADGTRANQVFSRATIARKINYKAAGCGTIAIKCRMGTMSEKERLSYERAGFKLEGQVVGSDGKPTGKYTTADPDKPPAADETKTSSTSRYIIDKITFPDGKVVTSGDGFFKYTKAKVSMNVASVRAFNPRSAFFLNERFSNILEKTFNFLKGKPVSGKTKPEIDKSFNENSGGSSEEDLKNNTKPTRTEEKARGVSEKAKSAVGNGAMLGATGGCQAYNLARYGIAAVKIAKMYELVGFALPWLQAADQIKDQGKISPEVVDNLSSRLTSFENNKTMTEDTDYAKKGDKNPKYDLTATDSDGYKIAEYGSKAALAAFAQKWLLGGGKNSTVSSAQSVLSSVNSTLGFGFGENAGSKVIRYTCKTLGSPLAATVGIAALVVDCASTFVGNEVTGPEGCLIGLGWAAAGVALTEVISHFGDDILKAALEESKLLNIGSDLNGVDAGDAIAAGAGLMLGATSTASGLQPSKSVQDSQQYIADTESMNNEYIAAARYDARSTPFDINNEYSFIGSIASKLYTPDAKGGSLFSSLSGLSSIFTSAMSVFPDTAGALYSMPSFSPAERYDCPDPDLQGIGAIGDKYCSIATLMPSKDLKDAQAQVDGSKDTIDDVIDYMLKEQTQNEADGGTADDSFGGDESSTKLIFDPTRAGEEINSTKPSIDDTGKPTPGSQYSLYLKYCTDARVTAASATTWDGEQGAEAYWGTTTQDVENGSNRDQDWYSGRQCTDPINSKMMSMFRQYTNYCLQTATMQGSDNCWSDAAATTTNSANCGDGTNASIYTCALFYDHNGYGPHPHGDDIAKWSSDLHNNINPLTGATLQPGTPLIDCSGLVTLAVYDAFGIDLQKVGNIAPQDFQKAPYWTKVDNPEQNAQKGDVITMPNHVEIIESVSNGTYKTFGAHQNNPDAEKDISPSSYSGSYQVYRFNKGGVVNL